MRYTILLLLIPLMTCAQIRYVPKKDCEPTQLFEILKIKENKSYYIVYAQRNDSLFKILSDKDKRDATLKKNRVKEKYELELIRIFPTDTLLGLPVAPNLGIKYILLKGNTSIGIEGKFHNAIYRAKNLDGLAIVK